MRHGRIRGILALALAVMLVLAYIPGGYCDEMAEHEVDQVGVRIRIPEGWFYGDRGITDDSEFCTVLHISAEDFKGQYVAGDVFLSVFDRETGTYLTLNVTDSNAGDYTEKSDSEIQKEGDDAYAWVEMAGNTAISQSVVRLGRPYYRFVGKDNDVTFYYYQTVLGGKRYVYCFMVDNDKTSGELEKLYEEIVESAGYAGDTGSAKNDGSPASVADIIANAADGRRGLAREESFHFDDCDMQLRKEYRYAKRGDENLDFSEEYVFEHVECTQAIIYNGDQMAFLSSHPVKYSSAMTDNECMAEILTHTTGGFGNVGTRFTAASLGGNRFIVWTKDDLGGSDTEYIVMYLLHKNGIIEVSVNGAFGNDDEREKMRVFLKDIVDSITPAEALPRPREEA